MSPQRRRRGELGAGCVQMLAGGSLVVVGLCLVLLACRGWL